LVIRDVFRTLNEKGSLVVNWPEIVTGAFGGAAGTLVVVYSLSHWPGDVWKEKILEKVRQDNRKELETLRQDNLKLLETAQQDSRKELETLKLEMQASVDKANRLLDAGISKAILVTRTHFETEFAAYKEIFAALTELSHRIRATRPTMIITSERETTEQRLAALTVRLKELSEAHNIAVTLSANLSPFYHEEIFLAIEKCLKASGLEIFQVETAGPATLTSDWYDQGHNRQTEFADGYVLVSRLIRDRLASLGVLPVSP
jgi:hypothetical protein